MENKGSKLPSTEEFKKWSRGKKRALVLIVGGKKVPIKQYLSNLAKEMPLCRVKGEERIINHLDVLNKLYMQEGLEAVAAYREKVVEAIVDAMELDKQEAEDGKAAEE